MSRYRVIQWGVGYLGTIALRYLLGSRDLELVGVKCFTEEKVGRSAGELAEQKPAGVSATDDAAALIDLEADCVLYMPRDALLDPSVPDSQSAVWVDELLAILASGKIRRIDTWEIVDYGTYPVHETLQMLGFGLHPDQTPSELLEQVRRATWGGVPYLMAELPAVPWRLPDGPAGRGRVDARRRHDDVVGPLRQLRRGRRRVRPRLPLSPRDPRLRRASLRPPPLMSRPQTGVSTRWTTHSRSST